MKIRDFEDLVAWRKSKELSLSIRECFSNNKDYSFKDQIFRASLSTMNNLAEGFDRGTDKELIHFLHIARGCCSEVRSMLSLAEPLGYIATEEHQHLRDKCVEISKIISGLKKSLSTKDSTLETPKSPKVIL